MIKSKLDDYIPTDKSLCLSPFQEIISRLDYLAQKDSPVFMIGGTGTGKRFLARKAHASGPRKHGPFITLHCSQIENKLKEKITTSNECIWSNILEQADKGTLIACSIDEMSHSLQDQLADYIQNKHTQPEVLFPDVRLVCTVNREPDNLLSKQKLSQRLSNILYPSRVYIPELVERKEYIKPLCYRLLTVLTKKLKRNIQDFTPEALQFLITYPWPGNITQLINIIERAIILEDSPWIKLESIYFPELSSTQFLKPS
ncbi:MAG TPA: sigma 54-interacting transcriptional regulator [Desulfohalobiaceae bacterium]|nr:sigma 54-interacting transcriptional regulator [Desulfohalobiaceae bacterium]